jgi:hypothetical protein
MLIEGAESVQKPTLSQCLLGGNHSLNAVVHVLDEVFLGAAKSALVGDVKSAVGAFRVFTVDTADLDVELISDLLECCHILAELWKLDVD